MGPTPSRQAVTGAGQARAENGLKFSDFKIMGFLSWRWRFGVNAVRPGALDRATAGQFVAVFEPPACSFDAAIAINFPKNALHTFFHCIFLEAHPVGYLLIGEPILCQ